MDVIIAIMLLLLGANIGGAVAYILAARRVRLSVAREQLAQRRAQAAEHRVTPQDELRLLTVHGLLHLLGMDHAEPDEEREMTALTRRLLDLHAARGAA